MILSVVIASWNTAPLLAACLRTLPDAAGTVAFEVIVVDNASTDASADRVASEFPGVRLIRNAENLGFGRANNQGIALAQGRFVLLLNSDTLLPAGALAGLVDFMAAHPRAGACSPALLLPNGQAQAYAFGDDPSLGYLLRRGINRLVLQRPLHDWATAISRPVDWVSGACLVLRREAAGQVGGSTGHVHVFRGCRSSVCRLQQAGWEVWHHPAVGITHLGGQSMKQNPAAQAAYQQSLRYFYRQHYGKATQLTLNLVLGIYGRLAG
ncbi:MAG: glycosyltransferase family 2 protein [Caldilineales bacterium]|nr:glycosyltransferase family 2 protein [Caldilineales bacterium]